LIDYKTQIFLENIDLLVGIVNPNNKFEFEFVNEHIYINLLGYTSKELIGESFLNLLHHDDLHIVKKILKKKTESEDYLNEIRLKHKNNKYIWFEIKKKRFKDDSDKEKILIILKNISNRKKIEKKLRENEDRFKKLTITIPEIRFWKLFNPKKYEAVLQKSYEMLHTVMESIPQYIFWKDINSTYLGCNHSYIKLIGIEYPEEIIGKTDNDFLTNKEKIKHLKEHEAKVMITKKPEFHIVESWVLKKGTIVWLDINRIPLFDSEENVVGILVTLEDITEKKIYEELIFELNNNFLNFTTDVQENLKLLLDTCFKLMNGDLVLYIYKNSNNKKEQYQVITSDNQVFNYNSEYFLENIFVNQLFLAEHDVPQTFFDLNETKYAKTDRFIINNKIKACYGKLIQSHTEFNSALCVFYKNKPNTTDRDNMVLYLIGDAIEIEQKRRQMQQDLEAQNIMLNEINKVKTELLSRTSHELKTPLVSIKGFTELLLVRYKSELDDKIVSILEEIMKGSQRLENIINSLLQSSKLDKDKLELKISKGNLTSLIKDCGKELQGLAELRKQSIIFKIQDSLSTNFDKEMIHDVISNLLTNAIKYTPPEGNIIIQSKIKDDFYIISIEDNGIGLTEEEKKQLFKQFGKIERYGKGWDVIIEGTGLGLYISKKIVELHGGKIWVESEGRNKGSTFYFSIPRID